MKMRTGYKLQNKTAPGPIKTAPEMDETAPEMDETAPGF